MPESSRPTSDKDTFLSLRPRPTAAASAAVSVYLQAVPEKDPTAFRAELTLGHSPDASESLLLEVLNMKVLTEEEFRVTEVFNKRRNLKTSKSRFVARLQERLEHHYASAQIYDLPRVKWNHSYAVGSLSARFLVKTADGETVATAGWRGADVGSDPAPSPKSSSKKGRSRAAPGSRSRKQGNIAGPLWRSRSRTTPRTDTCHRLS